MEKTILFRFDANEKLGMGHYYRVQILSQACSGYRCLFAISKETRTFLGNKIDSRFRIIESNEDIIKLINEECVISIVNDVLNTSYEYIQGIKSLTTARVINLEDEGKGATLADAVINELYETGENRNNCYYGHKFCCLDPSIKMYKPNEFREEVKRAVVLFGCTDPADLSIKTLCVLKKIHVDHVIYVDIIAGPGYTNIGELTQRGCEEPNNKIQISVHHNVDIKEYMQNADFAVSSQGRTIFDLAYFRIPTIIMAQNDREMLHTFATETNGFLNLGLGTSIEELNLEKAIKKMIEDRELRKELYNCMSQINLENGVKQVVELIVGKD